MLLRLVRLGYVSYGCQLPVSITYQYQDFTTNDITDIVINAYINTLSESIIVMSLALVRPCLGLCPFVPKFLPSFHIP